MDDDLRDLSNSELRTYKRCRRKWWLSYHLALQLKRPEVAGARAIGTRLHVVLAAYYDPARTDVNDVRDCLALHNLLVGEDQQRVLSHVPPDSEYVDWKTDELLRDLAADADLGRAMVEGYFEWLEEEGADANLEVIGSERTMRVPFGGGLPIALIAKLDLKVRLLVSGATAFIDHKSVDQFTVPARVAHLDEQFRQYALIEYLAHRLADGDPTQAAFTDGGIFNFIKKVKRTKAAKPPFFLRVEVRHNLEELRSHWSRLHGEAEDLLRTEVALRAGADHRRVAYANPTRDCHWDCDFFKVCAMLDDPHSDAEGLLAAAYEPHDPYLRYRVEPTKEADG